MSGKLERVEKVTGKVSVWLNVIAAIAMVLMLLVVFSDVVGAKLFRQPLPGAFDVPSLLGLLIIALAIPLTHTMGGHVKIEFFAERMNKRTQAIMAGITSIVSLVLFGAITWQMFRYSMYIQRTGVVTSTAEIPIYPFTYVAVIAFFLMCPILLVQFLRAVSEARSR